MIRSTAVVALLLLLGRVAGFVREWSLALTGGASGPTDSAIVLLTFPDLVVNLLLSGGLAASLVPAFQRLSKDAAFALMLKAGLVVGAVFTLIAIGLSVAAVPVLTLLAPGIAEHIDDRAVALFRLTNVALPLGAVSGVIVCFLNSQNRFATGAAGTLVFNLAIIGFVATIGWTDIVGAIVYGVIVGAALRLIMQMAPLAFFQVRPDFAATATDPGLIGRFVGAFGFVSFLSVMPPIARALASTDQAGSLSLFNFAYKLIELPMALVVSAITTVMLPRIAGQVAAGARDAARSEFATTLRVGFIIMLAISIPSVVFAESLVRIAFFSSSLSDAQLRTLGNLAGLGLAALPVQELLMISATGFAAFGTTRPLVVTGALMLAVLLAWGALAPWGPTVEGVMLGYVLALCAGTLFLAAGLPGVIHQGIVGVLRGGGYAGILIPACGALAIALAGKFLSLPIAGQTAFAAMSFAVFIGLYLLVDKQARLQLARSYHSRTRSNDSEL